MKKIFYLLALPLIALISSCGNSKPQEENNLEGMKEVKIVLLDDSLSIWVPENISGNMEITQQAWGATEIKIGEGFQISIEQSEGDFALQKSDIEGNDVYKLQRYITDEPALLFWESKIPDMENSTFHFYTIVTVGKTPYLIKDVDSGVAYTEEGVKAMIKSAKTLQKTTQGANEEESNS
jgi:hypothetical protein